MTDLDKHHFDHLLTGRAMFTVGQTAKIVGLSAQSVIDTCDAGRLHHLAFNSGKGVRMTRRIPRDAVVLFLLQTKTYAVEDYLAGVVGLLGQLSLPELRRVQGCLPQIAERAEARLAALTGNGPGSAKAARGHQPPNRTQIAQP